MRRFLMLISLIACAGCSTSVMHTKSPAGESMMVSKERPFSSETNIVEAPSSLFEECVAQYRGIPDAKDKCLRVMDTIHAAQLNPCKPFFNGYYMVYPAYDPRCR